MLWYGLHMALAYCFFFVPLFAVMRHWVFSDYHYYLIFYLGRIGVVLGQSLAESGMAC